MRDLLHSGARNLKVAEQRKQWIVFGMGIATLLGASVLGSEEGWLAFGAAAAIGAIATYGTNEFLTRRMRAPLEKRGIEIDRLMVE